MKWRKHSNKQWRSDCGQVIVDHSFYSGGKRVAMYAVYRSLAHAEWGDNYDSGLTLTEAKRIASSQCRTAA